MKFPDNSFSKRLALVYIAYMMAGSYFAGIRENWYLSRLYMHYAEMGYWEQIRAESWLLRRLNGLPGGYLDALDSLVCEVRYRVVCDRDVLEFYTGFEGLLVYIENDRFYIFPAFAGVILKSDRPGGWSAYGGSSRATPR